MDSVAFAATIGGSVVALAGVEATAWSVSQQRKSAQELAAAQHEHERRLARGARLFERRVAVYEELLVFLTTVYEEVRDIRSPMTGRVDDDREPDRRVIGRVESDDSERFDVLVVERVRDA